MKVPIIVKCFKESTCPPLDKCIVCGVCGYDKYWNEEQTCKQEDDDVMRCTCFSSMSKA
jgi:hypothetical protein